MMKDRRPVAGNSGHVLIGHIMIIVMWYFIFKNVFVIN